MNFTYIPLFARSQKREKIIASWNRPATGYFVYNIPYKKAIFIYNGVLELDIPYICQQSSLRSIYWNVDKWTYFFFLKKLPICVHHLCFVLTKNYSNLWSLVSRTKSFFSSNSWRWKFRLYFIDIVNQFITCESREVCKRQIFIVLLACSTLLSGRWSLSLSIFCRRSLSTVLNEDGLMHVIYSWQLGEPSCSFLLLDSLHYKCFNHPAICLYIWVLGSREQFLTWQERWIHAFSYSISTKQTQTNLAGIWTWFTDSIFHFDNHYATFISLHMYSQSDIQICTD